jgi:hypothetical protein
VGVLTAHSYHFRPVYFRWPVYRKAPSDFGPYLRGNETQPATAARPHRRAASFLDSDAMFPEATGMSNPTLTDDALDGITAAAPAGPWRVEHYVDGGVETYAVESDAEPVCVLTDELAEDLDDDQRAEIVAALTVVAAALPAMPALLATVRRLRAADDPVITGPAHLTDRPTHGERDHRSNLATSCGLDGPLARLRFRHLVGPTGRRHPGSWDSGSTAAIRPGSAP